MTLTAARYSAEMNADKRLDHADAAGHRVAYRVERDNPSLRGRWAVLGENLGWGNGPLATPRAIVEGWMNSGGHGVYGPLAFGTSAYSDQLTDWPRGGVVGIHGTNQPRLVPGRPPHGCIRLQNRDIRRLARLLPIGTPLLIR